MFEASIDLEVNVISMVFTLFEHEIIKTLNKIKILFFI